MPSANPSPNNASATNPHASQTVGTSASQQQQRQQQLSKLDGVLYHFYSTTANVIIQSRLINYRRSHKQVQEAQLQARLTKWFALQIPELDLFKEELRLWRSISSMLQLDDEGRAPAGIAAGSIPPLVVDIILDLSSVPQSHVVQLWKRTDTDQPPHFLASSGGVSSNWQDRVPIDGQTHGRTTQQIVLERWKLEFEPGSPAAAPELPTLYKRSITHFRSLFTLVNALPVGRLCSRIENAQRRAETVAATKTKRDSRSEPSPPGTSDVAGELDYELRIGCRLSMAEEASLGGAAEIGIDHLLQAERESTSEAGTAPRDSREQAGSLRGATSERRFSPIVTPLGTMQTTVRFRRLADFSVQDIQSLESIKEMQIEMDEDYFRPTVEMVRKRTESGTSGMKADMRPPAGPSNPSVLSALGSNMQTGPELQQQPAPVQSGQDPPISEAAMAAARIPLPTVKGATPSEQARPQSLLSATAHQRVGGPSNTGAATSTSASPYAIHAPGSMGPPSVIPGGASASPSPTEQLLSRSPATNISVFSTSAPGRPVAGLSSLRRAGSITSNISNLGSSGLSGATPSSPALAAALSTEPAFLTMGQPRRPSTSERRMRTISSTSSGRDSPPSSITGTGASATPAVASTGPTSISLRSSLGRISSGPIPVSNPHLRSSSFSPSSPSPLNQQISMPLPSVGGSSHWAASTSASRLSSSPGMRSGVAIPSLRSVFQSYAPHPSSSLAQTSSACRRSISTSEAGSISALGSSSSGAKPQMIKRYSTNFGYRQNRESSRYPYGSSLGAVAGAEPASLPSSGAGSLGTNFGRSWSTRMEQRQQSGAFVRSSTSTDDVTSGSASTSIRFRSSPAAGAIPTGAYTPSPGSQDGDLDDLMRLIDARPVLRSTGARAGIEDPAGGSGSGAATPAGEAGRKTSPGSSSSAEARDDTRPRTTMGSSSSSLGARNASGKAGVYASIRGTNPLSRSQIDDMLSRMVQSINLTPPERSTLVVDGGAAASERVGPVGSSPLRTSSDVGHPGFVSSTGTGAASPHARYRASVRGAFDRASSTTSGNGGAPSRTVLSHRGAPSPVVGTTATTTTTATVAASSMTGHHGGPAGPIGTGQVRGLRTVTDPTGRGANVDEHAHGLEYHPAGTLGLSRDQRLGTRGKELDSALNDALLRGELADGGERHRAESIHSLELGELQPNYDPMDDEAAGRMEMPTGDPYDEEFSAEPSTRYLVRERHDPAVSGPLSANRLRGPSLASGYQITRSRSGTSRSSPSSNGGAFANGGGAGVTMDWERGERERQRERELERRRADAEMARNFGNEVGASTRGRGSRSPWRHGFASPSAPSSISHAVGFGGAMATLRHGGPASLAGWGDRDRGEREHIGGRDGEADGDDREDKGDDDVDGKDGGEDLDRHR